MQWPFDLWPCVRVAFCPEVVSCNPAVLHILDVSQKTNQLPVDGQTAIPDMHPLKNTMPEIRIWLVGLGQKGQGLE